MTILPPFSAWCAEAMMIAVLMWVVIGVSTGVEERSITAGLAVGAVIAMVAFVAISPPTNASMNPARSLGPAIASGHWADLWFYLSAPVTGAMIGGWGYQWARVRDEQPARETFKNNPMRSTANPINSLLTHGAKTLKKTLSHLGQAFGSFH